jgi:hypothetical protein
MIWFFARDAERLRYEIRRAADDESYELAVEFPDGTAEVEEVRDPADLLARCAERALGLKDAGWRPLDK